MGLAVESVQGAFSFFKKNMIVILYQLIFLIIYGVLAGIFLLIILGNLSLTQITNPLSAQLFRDAIAKSILETIALGVIFAVVFIVQNGGYPLLVKQAKGGKVNIFEAIGQSFKNIVKIVATGIIQFLPVFLLIIPLLIILVGIGIPTSTPGTPVTPSGLAALFGIAILSFLVMLPIVLYIETRLWLSLSVLMIEGKGVIPSVKRGWQITKSKFWSIFAALFLYGIIVGIIQLIFTLPTVISPAAGTVSIIIFNLINVFVLQVIGNALAPVYYYNATGQATSKSK